MKKTFGFIFAIVFVSFFAQWGYTGSVSPPANIWSEYPAQSRVDMDGFKIVDLPTPPSQESEAITKGWAEDNFDTADGYLSDDPSDVDLTGFGFTADTVDVNTVYHFPDDTTQNTSPQACASGEALNNSGCESFSTSSDGGGSDTIALNTMFTLAQVPPNEDVEKLYKVPAGDTYTVTRAGVTDNNFSNSDNFQLAIRDQFGNLQQAYTTKEDTTTVDVNGDWIVFSLENNTSDTVEITGYAEVQK